MSAEGVRGVDFGTSTSWVAESTVFGPQIVPVGRAERWFPSIVGIDGAAWLVGEESGVLPEEQLVRSVKRLITQRDDTAVVSNGIAEVEVDANEVIVAILTALSESADANQAPLNVPGSIRLGCPAIWDGEQRKRFIHLANKAGIAVGDSTLIDEPIAAGVAWVGEMLRRRQTVHGKVLVFDMGGGTLDVAVIEVDARSDREPGISVQAADGLDEAGDDLDVGIVRDLEAKYEAAGFFIDALPQRDDVRAWVRAAASHAKVELGSSLDVPVVVDFPDVDVPIVNYSREELETVFEPQLDRAMEVVARALRAALMVQVAGRQDSTTLTPAEARARTPEQLMKGVSYVILAGGMAKVPAVLKRMTMHFPPDAVYIGASDDPSQTIVAGLAEPESYERLNLHRPGFDFALEWEDESGETMSDLVYAAYSRLYTEHDVFHRNSTKYSWNPASGSLPAQGRGMVKVKSVSGVPITFRFEGADAEGIVFDFGHVTPHISLEPSGRVFIRDGMGRQSSVRISQWPVIRGVGFEAITVVRDETKERKGVPELVWHQKPYD
ncbi:Hsp70 family protein [Homoserinimonas sp. A447]